MKFKNVIRSTAAAAVMAIASASASAGYVVLDGWQLVSPSGVGITTNIGRLVLGGGGAKIQQEVNGSGQVFAGARFREDGLIFSLSYTPENTVGAGDIGLAPLHDFLTISFTNVTGVVTQLNGGGGFKYSFLTGSFNIKGAGGSYADGSIVGIGGNAASTSVIGGTNGDSTLLAKVTSFLTTAFDMRDSTGNSLKSDMLAGTVLFEAVTNNNVPIGGANGTAGACSFDSAAQCNTFNVVSDGSAYLVRNVPEPGTVALAGLALLGMGAARRRKSSV